jgi:hypothetical protein
MRRLGIVHRYLSSCPSDSTSNQDGGMVYFHHAASAKWTGGKIVKKVGIPDVHNPIVCGHNINIGMGLFDGNEEEVTMLDTKGIESDIHLGAIEWDKGRCSASLISFDFSHLSVDARIRGNANSSVSGKWITLPLHDKCNRTDNSSTFAV